MKKFFAILLSAMLMLSLAVPAMAANTVSVTLPEGMADHTFYAYQIFTGTQAASEGALGDVAWGDGINTDNFLKDLQASSAFGTSNPFAGCTTVASVASEIAKFTNDSSEAKEIAKIANKNLVEGKGKELKAGANDLEKGYYLIVDKTDVDGKDTVANASLLQVTDSITIGVKAEKPTLDKVIKDADSDEYENPADENYDGNGTAVNVGDRVEFEVTSKVPNMTGYDSYTFIVTDTMSKGLTPVIGDDGKVAVTITIDGASYTDFTVSATDANGKFTITFNNFINQKDKAGKAIVISYAAILNEEALKTDVETNTVDLQYSNNPNNSDSQGDTLDKTVYVYDFDIVIDKYTDDKTEGEDTRLEGAQFVLYKTVDGVKQYYYYNADDDKVEWYSLKGDETLESVLATTPAKITEVATDSNGAAKFQGLDAGVYYLQETKAPAGYNLVKEPTTVTITATYKDDGIIVTSSAESENGGQYEQTQQIENKAGATLPETGGMGTTIFYIVGGVMVAAAVVLLITKKRMSAEG